MQFSLTQGMMLYIGFQIYSALVQSLPKPTEYGGLGYKSLYTFLCIIAADFKSMAGSFNPTQVGQSTQGDSANVS